MSYNTDHLRTAGKITVYTALIGVFVFAVVFAFNLGEKQVKQAEAVSTATTSVTVLNTPPVWTATTTEVVESSATNPTNEGDIVSWQAIGTDSNNERYYLLICSNSNTPATTTGGLPPSCTGGATQWAVSASTTSGEVATAATTTTASSSPFAGESFQWFAWICDVNNLYARCNPTYTQGVNATNSSPFEVNHRPRFSVFTDPVVGIPGQLVTFTSTSSDDDISGVADTVFLTVCATSGFNTTTNACTGTTLATSSAYVANDASASYTIVIPTQDQNYSVYPYIIDSHGLESAGVEQGVASTLTVSNVAPTVDGSLISLIQPVTTNIVLSTEAGESTGFVMSFVTIDNNSCDSPGGLNAYDEMTGYELSLYRNGGGNSSSTCNAASGLNPNNCYPSGVAPTAWNLSCTASSTTCSGSSDTSMLWECTFPLWYVADPTDGTATSTQYSTGNWLAQVRGADINNATGTYAEATNPVEVTSFLAFALNTLSIPYGSLEPGQKTPLLVATTTIAATGNVGLDKDVTGSSMCSTYTNASPCLPSSTSTIPESEQVFATSSITYDAAEALLNTLSSTTPKIVPIHVPKSTATSTQAVKDSYWGIRVPASISFAGSYTGQNTFTARVATSTFW